MLYFVKLNVNLTLTNGKFNANNLNLIQHKTTNNNKKYIDMKTLLNTLILLFCITAFSQEQKVDYKKVNDDLVKATYYFADNNEAIEREGFFDANGKLHGTWISYNLEGNKTSIANYVNGKKDGVWTYFKEDKINLVTYNKNKITKVEEKALVIN